MLDKPIRLLIDIILLILAIFLLIAFGEHNDKPNTDNLQPSTQEISFMLGMFD